jgi:hypothetical protein
MPETATIKSLPVVFAMVKALEAEGVEWGEDYRGAARHALAELLQGKVYQEPIVCFAAAGNCDRVP